jgi:hypothetical protein
MAEQLHVTLDELAESECRVVILTGADAVGAPTKPTEKTSDER